MAVLSVIVLSVEGEQTEAGGKGVKVVGLFPSPESAGRGLDLASDDDLPSDIVDGDITSG